MLAMANPREPNEMANPREPEQTSTKNAEAQTKIATNRSPFRANAVKPAATLSLSRAANAATFYSVVAFSPSLVALSVSAAAGAAATVFSAAARLPMESFSRIRADLPERSRR